MKNVKILWTIIALLFVFSGFLAMEAVPKFIFEVCDDLGVGPWRRFKDVILRHYPELASTGLGNVKNAFEPWDTSPVLSEERHPLRAFDPELKKDPWKGDAAREGETH